MITPSRQLCVLVSVLAFGLLPTSGDACVGPPPEPFCTKTLQLAIAGPPVVLLPSGGTFDVSALVYFGLLEFPPGFGICPDGPHAVDVAITATCTPGGANGFGEVLSASIVTGYNELTVPVVVPAGPPRHCVLSAVATLTLGDGMVLTETADNVACLGDPAPGQPNRPRIDLRPVGGPTEAIARTHPGDPATVLYEIINNDPDEVFTGTLTVDSINESRMPGFSGPMPPGTAVVSVSDPVEGDNFPIEVNLLTLGLTEGLSGGDVCVELPEDPAAPDVPIELVELELQPFETVIAEIASRPWGMCSDGSCSRSTLNLTGSFSDATTGFACSGFVAAADILVPPAYECPESGMVVYPLPPTGPKKLPIRLTPRPDAEIDVEVELVELSLAENGFPLPEGLPFTDLWSQEAARMQVQFADTFAVDSFFDVSFEINLQPLSPGGVELEITGLDMIGAPTGFDSTAPFVSPRIHMKLSPQQESVGFFYPTIQVSAVGIDNLGERRRVSFDGIVFDLPPGGNRLTGTLTGGTVAPGAGSQLDAFEFVLDFKGFASEEALGSFVFTDGFESGNVSRWSNSQP